MNIKCVVMCTDSCGIPTAFKTKVKVSEESYRIGEHYDIAVQRAIKKGYEEPMIVLDEHDNKKQLLEAATWLNEKETK